MQHDSNAVLDTQMYLAEELLQNEELRAAVLRDLELGASTPLGRPVVVQLAGNNAETLVQAGLLVQEYCDAIGITNTTVMLPPLT
jgi:tRNA-dihydrouridine synthase 1